MRERAKLMGGKLTVWTAVGSGTEVELIIPAAHAYAASTVRGLLRSSPGKACRASYEQRSQPDSDSIGR
jgi:hypothetical protein